MKSGWAVEIRWNRVGGGVSPPSSHTTVRAFRHTAVSETLGSLRVEVHQAQKPLVAPVGEADGFVHLRGVRKSPVCLARRADLSGPLIGDAQCDEVPSHRLGLLPLFD